MSSSAEGSADQRGKTRVRDDAQEVLDTALGNELVGRDAFILLAEREDPLDLTSYPGGWWCGTLASFDEGTQLFTFYFEVDEEDAWEIQLELYEADYDPYFDPMSEPAVGSWYLVEQ